MEMSVARTIRGNGDTARKKNMFFFTVQAQERYLNSKGFLLQRYNSYNGYLTANIMGSAALCSNGTSSYKQAPVAKPRDSYPSSLRDALAPDLDESSHHGNRRGKSIHLRAHLSGATMTCFRKILL
ncbi:hypothetical protein AKJ16_DCAP10436 [Drosera capensis]